MKKNAVGKSIETRLTTVNSYTAVDRHVQVPPVALLFCTTLSSTLPTNKVPLLICLVLFFGFDIDGFDGFELLTSHVDSWSLQMLRVDLICPGLSCHR